jgi:hypothetical protein
MMKTLKQLWEANNCQPFWAKGEDNTYFYMQAISLSGDCAFGSNELEKGYYWHPDYPSWIPWHDPRKPVPKPKEKLVLWRKKSTLGIQREVGELVLLTEEEFIKRFDRVADTWERVRLSDLLEGE